MVRVEHHRHRRSQGLLVVLAVGAGALYGAAPVAASIGSVRSPRSAATACPHPTMTFAFSHKTVVEGKSAALEAGVSNCTSKKFSGSLEIYGKLACLVLDPVVTKVTLAPGSAQASVSSYLAPECTGPGSLTGVLLNAKGKAISTKMAKLKVVAPPPG